MAAGNQGFDASAVWLVLLVAACAAAFGIWLATYQVLGPFLIDIKRAELWLVSFFSDDAAKAYDALTSYLKTMRGYIVASSGAYSHQQMWSLVAKAAQVTGVYYHGLAAILIMLMGAYIFFKFPASRFKNRYTLDNLINIQSVTWPVIKPFIKYNPVKGKARPPGTRVPTELPTFAEALYPEEWMAFHRIRMVSGVPDRDQIRRAFLLQLGPLFTGIDQLPDHLYCLAAAFALKGARKRDESDELLGAIAACWTPETNLRLTATVRATATKALTDRKLVEPLLEVMSRHAYVATAMIGALAWARHEGGVLAPAQFVWLRGEHREMWYPLNNAGRRSFHSEAAGAMAHYQAELEAARPLTMPRLDGAVVAMVQYLSETRARIPDLETGGKAPPPAIRAGDSVPRLTQQRR